MNYLRGFALLAAWLAIPAWADLPDPVRLGATVELGNIALVRGWLDEGLNPDTEADRIGTGLMIAAWEGNVPMMELFLSRGAKLHRVNRHGEQALQLAAWRGHTEAVRWLLDHGAQVNRESRQWTALHYAVFAGHPDIVRLLMSRGADVNARTPNDSSVLMMAARENREELARVLVDAGADPLAANERGDTALAWAMRYGHFRVAKLVSSAEAFARAVQAPPESFGKPVKSVAAPSEITELLRQIREAEANGQPTEALRRALMSAVERFKTDSTPLVAKGKKKTGKDRAPTLVITARRQGGERVEVVGEEGRKTPATPAQQSWAYEESRINELTALMQQLDEAEKAGRPTAQLRQAVRAAYQRLKER